MSNDFHQLAGLFVYLFFIFCYQLCKIYSIQKLDSDPRRDNDISDVVLKNEGSIVQACRNINVHIDICIC